jgi:hypothetical protein
VAINSNNTKKLSNDYLLIETKLLLKMTRNIEKLKFIFLVMICCVLNIIVSGQVKKPPIKPKPTPAPKIENPITELEAKTKDGKKVILRSNGTWVYFKEEFD